MASRALLEAIAVTMELLGNTPSPAAAKVFAGDLSMYPEDQVMRALTRCRREVKSRLTIADVISRIEDGRPGPEEAWAMIPQDELTTVVWSDEMRVAWGVARPLIREDGFSAHARMAFVEKYRKLVADARERGEPVRWTPSLGLDPAGRESVITEAVRDGKLTIEHAQKLLPKLEIAESTLKLLAGVVT